MSKASKQTTVSVANAEQLLARFERERADLIERKAALADRGEDRQNAEARERFIAQQQTISCTSKPWRTQVAIILLSAA